MGPEVALCYNDGNLIELIEVSRWHVVWSVLGKFEPFVSGHQFYCDECYKTVAETLYPSATAVSPNREQVSNKPENNPNIPSPQSYLTLTQIIVAAIAHSNVLNEQNTTPPIPGTTTIWTSSEQPAVVFSEIEKYLDYHLGKGTYKVTKPGRRFEW
jgi:hypothetical protein